MPGNNKSEMGLTRREACSTFTLREMCSLSSGSSPLQISWRGVILPGDADAERPFGVPLDKGVPEASSARQVPVLEGPVLRHEMLLSSATRAARLLIRDESKASELNLLSLPVWR